MNKQKIFAAITFLALTALPLSSQFQPGDNVIRVRPECGYDFECFKQKEAEESFKVNQIERQEEQIDGVQTHNEKLEEIKRNAEQPGLEKERP